MRIGSYPTLLFYPYVSTYKSMVNIYAHSSNWRNNPKKITVT